MRDQLILVTDWLPVQGLLALPTGRENAWLQASQGWMGQRRLHSGPTRARSALHRHAESAELFDGSPCTNHLSQRLTNIWCRDERSVSADRRCLCVSQSIEHCVTEGGNTRAESCPRAHHHCREMSQNHILQTPGSCCPCTVFVCLCLSTSPCVSCVSGLNTPRSGLRILLTWNAPSFQD